MIIISLKTILSCFIIKVILNVVDCPVNCEVFSAIEELVKLALDEELLIKELEILAAQLNDDYLSRFYLLKLQTVHEKLILGNYLKEA